MHLWQDEYTSAFYQGDLAEGKRHGKGRQIWQTGAIYEGEWEDDMINGRGRLINEDGEVYWTGVLYGRYVGEWLKEKGHGKGRYMKGESVLIEGDWEEDQVHGFAREVSE